MIVNLAALRAQFTTRPPSLSEYAEDHPCRLHPLSLEQQKKQAKELLKTWRSGDVDDKKDCKLSDAQHAIAVMNGFKNWSQLKSHIELSRLAKLRLAQGHLTAPDAGMRTLHIRCGSDIQQSLALTGFTGDFLNVPDPYVHGPVPETQTLEEFIEIRAAYLSEYHDPDYDKVFADLSGIASELETAHTYDVVCLWFEHDPHDQLILASLLDYFSHIGKRPPILKMININHYPGVKRFNGIGQLPPEAMPVLWAEFREVTPEQFETGRQAWHAIRSSTPQAMLDLVSTGTPTIPTMAIALDRFLKQLPSERNGLNLTENLTLQILAERGATTAARLFGAYANTYEPLAFMGDSGYWHVLDDLALVKHPAIRLDKQGDTPNTWQVTITDLGLELLSNNNDWLKLNTVNRWVGGIHIDTNANNVFRIAS